jgi:preprotein translocase subunit SecG
MQSSKADGASNSIMGGNSDLFANRKERGGEIIITRVTAIVGLIFFVLCLIMTF